MAPAVHRNRAPSRRWGELDALDHFPGRHRPTAAVPAVRQAGEVPAAHAGDATEDPGLAREIQERQGRDAAADDEATAGPGFQPAVRLPADVPSDPDLHLAFPCAATPVQFRAALPDLGNALLGSPAEALHLQPDSDL